MKHMVVTWLVSKTYETNCFFFVRNFSFESHKAISQHTHARTFQIFSYCKNCHTFLAMEGWLVCHFIHFGLQYKRLRQQTRIGIFLCRSIFGGRKTNLIWRLHCFSPLAWGTSSSTGAGVRSTNKKLKKQTWYSWGIHCPPTAFNTIRLDLFPFNMICLLWFVLWFKSICVFFHIQIFVIMKFHKNLLA